MQTKNNPLPSVDLLHQLFSYDPESGKLTHKMRRCGATVGAEAGHMTKQGYRRVKIGKPLYLAHRVIYRMCSGNDPGDCEIDHADGDKTNNRFENLRIAMHGQNQANGLVYKNNKAGFRGVYWHSQHRKYVANICVNKKRIHLGLFRSATDAALCYNEAAVKHFGEFAKVNVI